ncbi:MAG: metallophosphoesterase [Bacillota bacterium]|nr:metallophosphoesterase [Bacillota bacterium]
MRLFIISDLHVSFAQAKPMEVFGEHWENHAAKIRESWLNQVGPDDVVLLGGDTSWSMRLEDALVDFEWISALPGTKVLIKGNHDYWWSHRKKLAARFPDLFFLQNDFFTFGSIAVCGTRGWNLPDSEEPEDEKIYRRELLRMEQSLEAATRAGYREIIVLVHYPPTPDGRDTEMTLLFERYGVRRVFYGHIHDTDCFRYCFAGYKNGVEYRLTSCDYLNFELQEIRVPSDFEDPLPLLRARGDWIDRLQRGEIDKAAFIEGNFALYSDVDRNLPTRVLGVDDGILKYNFFNVLAKKAMLDADRYEFCDPQKYRAMRREAHAWYDRKDEVTENFLRYANELDRGLRYRAYYIDTGSEYLNGKIFEIVFVDLDRVVFHSMSDRVRAMLGEVEDTAPSVIGDYVKTKNQY